MAITDCEGAPTRHSVGAVVSYWMTQGDNSRLLTVRNPSGQLVVVPAAGEDSVVGVANLVGQAGGESNVVVVTQRDDGTSVVRTARMAVSLASPGSGESHVPITDTCTMNALLAILLPGTSITLRLADNELGLDVDNDDGAPAVLG